MPEGVLPVLVTVPFDGVNAVADRKAFLDHLTYRMEFAADEGAAFYGQLQAHAFETATPVKGMQLYDTLQKELNFFPNYIENKRNVNGMLLTSNQVRDPERMAHLPPPRPYDAEHDEEYGEMEWDCFKRLALVADDPKV